jgi:hypothetical protein
MAANPPDELVTRLARMKNLIEELERGAPTAFISATSSKSYDTKWIKPIVR